MALHKDYMNKILDAVVHAYNGSGGDPKSKSVPFPNSAYIGLLTTLPTGYDENDAFSGSAEVLTTIPAYDSTKTYAVNDYCSYTTDEVTKKYKCTTAETTGEWDASKWTEMGTNIETGYHRMNLDDIGLGTEHYFSTPATGTFANGSTIKNSAAILFPESKVPWGDVYGFGLYSSLSGGNMYLFGGLQDNQGQTTHQAIGEKQVAVFSAEDLELKLV